VTGRRRSSRRLKVVLAGLVLAGSMSFLTISGTYAIFTSEERDAGATAASGTLTLSEVTNGATGTPCKSWSTGATQNANTGCALLISTPTLQYPGQSVSGTVALTNTGSVAASDLKIYMPTCTHTTSPSAAVVGGGDPCQMISDAGGDDGLQLTIEETSSTGTVQKCWYPVVATGTCTAASGWSSASPNSFGIFAQFVNNYGAAYDLGAGPAAGATRYFKVTVILPTIASNTLQGEEALFGLTWHLST
jgi:hypothetical protein